MVVLRSGFKACSSSSHSQPSRSTDVSHLNGSKRLRSRVPRPSAKSRKERKYTSKNPHDVVRPYATEAISVYNQITGEEYELVQPLFMEHFFLAPFTLHHIDFTAKRTEVADAPEELFFAELTTDDKGRSVKLCKCMGPKESISGDKNNGCCYCTSYSVQHPRDGGFMAGGAGLFTDESRPSLDGSGLLRSTVDPVRPKAQARKKCTSNNPQNAEKAYATEAISVYNDLTGGKYELVQPGFMEEHFPLEPFTLHHIDFTAKNTEVADAPEEVFFAELTTDDKGRSVKFCECMGPKESISDDKNNGCCYCTSYSVQHPMAGGFMAGRDGLFTDE